MSETDPDKADTRSAAAGPVEQCDSMNAHHPHGHCPGARGAFTGEYPTEPREVTA